MIQNIQVEVEVEDVEYVLGSNGSLRNRSSTSTRSGSSSQIELDSMAIENVREHLKKKRSLELEQSISNSEILKLQKKLEMKALDNKTNQELCPCLT